VVYFAGDTLLGRYFEPALLDAGKTAAIVDDVRKMTGGAPLIVNFEGVVLDHAPIGQSPYMHVMLKDLALPVLTRLGVTAASLANNHAFDFGSEGLATSADALKQAGIVPLAARAVQDFGAFRLLALNFVGDQIGAEPRITDPAQLDFVCELDAAPPFVAFVHWGAEYTRAPGDLERRAAARLSTCGVVLTIGAHSHHHAIAIETVNGGEGQMLFSLGNFLFDQRRPDSSGALLEMRIFEQGTVASRVIPIPNYFTSSVP
jgi:poly-gamma-glutamate synthesis protein (capsule biosynthesis protein)